MCADEHNQQFLYDSVNKLSLVVAGSGGTALDKNIHIDQDDKNTVTTKYAKSTFGFVSFKFSPVFIDIQYHTTEVEELGNKCKKTYNVKINEKGEIIPDGII